MYKIGISSILAVVFFCSQSTYAQKKAEAINTSEAPYSDFDFVVGEWDFYTPDGTNIGEQTYVKRENGHLILEEWKLNSGETGLGMSFVDPKTGLWRQVWMSPTYHIDYSGSIDENGAMVLEGTLYPNKGGKSSSIRGIWAKQPDGSIKQDFFVLDDTTNTWNVLFSGYTLPKTN